MQQEATYVSYLLLKWLELFVFIIKFTWNLRFDLLIIFISHVNAFDLIIIKFFEKILQDVMQAARK